MNRDNRRPAEGSAEGDSLPCLFRNNSIEIASTKHLKSASALGWNVAFGCEKFGIQNLGFLTLTFRDHVTCAREAGRRFNSLLTNVIRPRYGDYVAVLERTKRNRIHYHLIVVIGRDIRTGFDFDAIARRDYKTASKSLRDEWAFWRKSAPLYGFGRTELLPIKSSSEGIGRYVGKYIGKHMDQRSYDDKGVRLVRYSRGFQMATSRFMFLSPGSQEWRQKVAAFAHLVSETHGVPPTFAGIREALGPKWAHNNRRFISELPTISTH